MSEGRHANHHGIMKRRELGKDGPQISVIGYGAWEGGYHAKRRSAS